MSSRATGTNPRALGTNPRARATATSTDPKERLRCPGCGKHHSGYHSTPGPWPYCLSAYCTTCCPHPLAADKPSEWDDLDRRLLDRAKAEAVRLKEAGLL